MHPEDFIGTSAFFNLFQKPTKLVLCHTRMPTSGGRKAPHAQPFRSRHAVTCHNGMYFNPAELRKLWSIKKPTGVDSELVATYVADHGALNLPDFIITTDGPSAIAALEGDALYLVRSGNPIHTLHFPLPDDNEILIFASTPELLMNAARYVWLLPDSTKPTALPEHQLCHVSAHQVTPVGEPFKHEAWTATGYGWSMYDDDDELAAWRKEMGITSAEWKRASAGSHKKGHK